MQYCAQSLNTRIQNKKVTEAEIKQVEQSSELCCKRLSFVLARISSLLNCLKIVIVLEIINLDFNNSFIE